MIHFVPGTNRRKKTVGDGRLVVLRSKMSRVMYYDDSRKAYAVMIPSSIDIQPRQVRVVVDIF